MIEMTFEFDLVCALREGTDEGAILDVLYGGCCGAAQGDATSPAEEEDAASLWASYTGHRRCPVSGRCPWEAERRISRRSGMVCRRPGRTEGKR